MTPSSRRAAGARPRRYVAPRVEQSASPLFERWRTDGNVSARDEIFRLYVPIARQVAAMHWPSSEPFDDLFQVACLGLLGAIDRFDADRGVPFSVFALPTVLGEVKHHLRRTIWSAHVPWRTQQLAQRVEAAAQRLTNTLGRPARVEEIAQSLGIGTQRVLIGLDAARARDPVSLEALLGDVLDREGPHSDSLARDEAGYGRVELTAALASVARQLTLTERRAFVLRFEHDLTQDEIARRLGCSQMQVSRLLRKAVSAVLTQTGDEHRVRIGTSLKRAPRQRAVGRGVA